MPVVQMEGRREEDHTLQNRKSQGDASNYVYQVIFSRSPDGDITVTYLGKLNLYEIISVLELEAEKLKRDMLTQLSSAGVGKDG